MGCCNRGSLTTVRRWNGIWWQRRVLSVMAFGIMSHESVVLRKRASGRTLTASFISLYVFVWHRRERFSYWSSHFTAAVCVMFSSVLSSLKSLWSVLSAFERGEVPINQRDFHSYAKLQTDDRLRNHLFIYSTTDIYTMTSIKYNVQIN